MGSTKSRAAVFWVLAPKCHLLSHLLPSSFLLSMDNLGVTLFIFHANNYNIIYTPFIGSPMMGQNVGNEVHPYFATDDPELIVEFNFGTNPFLYLMGAASDV
jgi:hypothetical protein